MKKSLVFIDSNVWFSAFYKEGVCSQPLRVLEKKPSTKIVISELVLEEIVTNIREKIPEALSFIIAYMDSIKPIVVKNPKQPMKKEYNMLAHKKDLFILVSAVEYQCGYFITGNVKDFRIEKIKEKFGLHIVKPSQFLQLLNR